MTYNPKSKILAQEENSYDNYQVISLLEGNLFFFFLISLKGISLKHNLANILDPKHSQFSHSINLTPSNTWIIIIYLKN